MHLVCVGISHHTASVDLRERLTLAGDAADALLAVLGERYPQAEMTVLSTCNRTEVYVSRPLHGHPRVEQLVTELSTHFRVDPDQFVEAMYHYDNERAIRHLFRVTCGLDSMIVGEQQIVSQVRAAYDLAQRAETIGQSLHRVFQLALATSKRVRTATGIDQGNASIAGAAVDFARHLFETLGDKSILAIGAGEMVELALERFSRHAPSELVVANRSVEPAEVLAQRFGGRAAGLDQLDELLKRADVVISSTGSPQPLVDTARMKKIAKARRHRPVFILDIALPRDFDPAVGDLANVYRFDLDDLQRAVADADDQREIGLDEAEQLVERAVGECYALVQSGDVSELIRRLKRKLKATGDQENQRTLSKLMAADPEEFERLLDEHSERLLNKVLHKPLRELGRGGSQQAALYATAIRRLFEVDAEDLTQPERTTRRSPLPPGDR